MEWFVMWMQFDEKRRKEEAVRHPSNFVLPALFLPWFEELQQAGSDLFNVMGTSSP